MKNENSEFFYKLKNHYSPFYAGCSYGDVACLGGEEKYRKCWGFSSGIGDLDWWVFDEVVKLTQEEQDELIYILERNEKFLEYKRSIVPELAKLLGVEQYQIYRVPNKKIYEFIKVIHSEANDAEKREFQIP